jgi:hypothetical protein
MRVIGSKTEVKKDLELLLDTYRRSGSADFLRLLHKSILKKKIRFPVLEYIAGELYKAIPLSDQIAIADEIIKTAEIGSNVLAAIILQKRLEKHFEESFDKAAAYMIAGDKWYVCDIIGERVLGHALLTQPSQTIPRLAVLINHSDKWMVRSVGVAVHYAVKNGLSENYSEQMFQILLACSSATDFHTKKGIGWGAKTVAKFHPGIIKKFSAALESKDVKQWFKTKIKIGLSRAYKYAPNYTG